MQKRGICPSFVKKENNQYIYHYIYRDHLGNNRLVYADLNGDGVINPATEITEENNYYPFGLKHQGYNELPGEGYKYKFLNKEYEDSFALNVTETDFRHYDSALGRFHTADLLSELAPNHTPYRYGFNNPVLFSDPSGLFETYGQAMKYLQDNNLKGIISFYDPDDYSKGFTVTIIGGEFGGQQFYDFTELLPEVEIQTGGDGSDSSSGIKFLGFTPAEIGMLANGAGVYTGALQANSVSNMSYKYKAGSKTHTAKQLTEMNKTRMTKIANVSKVAGRNVGVFGSIVTAYQGATDGNGFTLGDGVKVGIGLITTFTPYGWIYGAIDMGFLIIHGTSLTDEIGNLIDSY